MAKSNKKYLSVIHDLITKISAAKSYGRKEVEFLHWRFTEYHDHYDEEENNPKEIIEYFSRYIDIILRYSENEDNDGPKIFKSNMTKYFNIIGDIASVSTIANSFVEEKTSIIFEYLTDPSIKTACAKELTRTYNQIIKCSDALIKAKLIDSYTIYLYKLSDIICACGDYEYQTHLVETIFRICSSSFIKKHVVDFFPETESLQHAFVKIDVENFDETRRIFLNTVNRVNRNVYSLISNDVFLDEVKVTPPTVSDQEQNFWIDFNLGTNTVGIYCDPLCLKHDPLTPDSQDSADLGWELITFFAENVKLVEVKKPKFMKSQENMPTLFRFTLSTPFHVQYPASEWITTSKQLKIVLFDVEVIEELQSWILPDMFKDRFKGYRSQRKYSKNANSSSMEIDFSKRTYKPLVGYRVSRSIRSVTSASTRSMKSLEDAVKARKPKKPENNESFEKRVFVGITSPDSTLLDTSINSINILPETQYFSAEEDFNCVDISHETTIKSKIDQKVVEEVRGKQRLIYQSKSVCDPDAYKTSIDESKGRVTIGKAKHYVSLNRQGLSPILEISEVSRSEQNSYVGRSVVDGEIAHVTDLTSNESEYCSPDIISTQTSTALAEELRNKVKPQTRPEGSEPLMASFNDDYQRLCNDLLNDIEKDLDDQGRQYQNQTVEVTTEKDGAIGSMGENREFVEDGVAVESLPPALEEFKSRPERKRKPQEVIIRAKEEIVSQMAQNTDPPNINNSEISELTATRSNKIKSRRHEDKIIKKVNRSYSQDISSHTEEKSEILGPPNLTERTVAKERASKVKIGESETSSVIRLLTPPVTVIDLTDLKGGNSSNTQTTSCHKDVLNNLEREENEGSLTSDSDTTWFDDNLMSPSNMDCNTDMNNIPMGNDELKENVEAIVNRENDLEEESISNRTPSERKRVVKEALVDNEEEIHLAVIDLTTMSDSNDAMDERNRGSSSGPNEISEFAEYDSDTSSAIICGAGIQQMVKLKKLKSQDTFGENNAGKNLNNSIETELKNNDGLKGTVGDVKSKCNEGKSVAEEIVDGHVTQNTENKLNDDKNQSNLKGDTVVEDKLFDAMFANGPEQDVNDQDLASQVISSSAQGLSKKRYSQRQLTKKPKDELPAEGAETISQVKRFINETGENSVNKEKEKMLPGQDSVNQGSDVIEGLQSEVTDEMCKHKPISSKKWIDKKKVRVDKKLLQNEKSEILKEKTGEMCENEPISQKKRIEKKKETEEKKLLENKKSIILNEKADEICADKRISPKKRIQKKKVISKEKADEVCEDKCDEKLVAEKIVEDHVTKNSERELNGNKNRSNLKPDTVLGDDGFILSQNKLFDNLIGIGPDQDQNDQNFINQVISSSAQDPSKRKSSQRQQKDVEINKKPEDELPAKSAETLSQLRQKKISTKTKENLLRKEEEKILPDQGSVNQASDIIEGSQPKLTEKKKILQNKKSKILKEKADEMCEDEPISPKKLIEKKKVTEKTEMLRNRKSKILNEKVDKVCEDEPTSPKERIEKKKVTEETKMLRNKISKILKEKADKTCEDEPTSPKKQIEKKQVLTSEEDNASLISQGRTEFSSSEKDDRSDEEFFLLPKRGGRRKIADTQEDNTKEKADKTCEDEPTSPKKQIEKKQVLASEEDNASLISQGRTEFSSSEKDDRSDEEFFLLPKRGGTRKIADTQEDNTKEKADKTCEDEPSSPKKQIEKKQVLTSEEDNASLISQGRTEFSSSEKDDRSDEEFFLLPKRGGRKKIAESQEDNAAPVGGRNLRSRKAEMPNKDEKSVESVLMKTCGQKKKGVCTQEGDEGAKLAEKLVLPTKRGRKKKSVATQEDNVVLVESKNYGKNVQNSCDKEERSVSQKELVTPKRHSRKKQEVVTQDENLIIKTPIMSNSNTDKELDKLASSELEIQLVSEDKKSISANDNIPSEDVIYKNEIPHQIYDVHTEVEISSSQKSKNDGKRKLSQSDAKLYEKKSRTKRRVMYDPNDFTHLESDFANHTREFEMSIHVQTNERKTPRKENLLGNVNKTKTILKKSPGTIGTRSRNKTIQDKNTQAVVKDAIKLNEISTNVDKIIRTDTDASQSLFGSQGTSSVIGNQNKQKENAINIANKRPISSEDESSKHIEVHAVVVDTELEDQNEKVMPEGKSTANKDEMRKLPEGFNNKLPEHIDMDEITIVEDLDETIMRKTEKTANKDKMRKLPEGFNNKVPEHIDVDDITIVQDLDETIMRKTEKVMDVTTTKNKRRSSRKTPLTKKTADITKSETGTRKQVIDDFFTKFNRDVIFTEEDRKRRETFDLCFGDIMNLSRDIERRKRKRKLARDLKIETQCKKAAMSHEVLNAPQNNSKPKIKILDNVLLKPARMLHRAEIEFDRLGEDHTNQMESKDVEAESSYVRLWKGMVKIHQDMAILLQNAPPGQEKTKEYQRLLEYSGTF